MIKIIKKGTRQKIECGECGCYFSFDDSDIELVSPSSYPLAAKTKIIRCPQCESIIHLSAEVRQGENSITK